MTLDERAREIMGGVVGFKGRDWEEGDVRYIRSKLTEFLHEAMGAVCIHCKDQIPVSELGAHSFAHDFAGRGVVYCLASPIRVLLR